jgi:hypothetical protein
VIPDFFLSLLDTVISFAFGLLNNVAAWTEPAMFQAGGSYRTGLASVGASASTYGNWVPWTLVIAVYGACLSLMAIMYAVKVVTWVWARVPIVGGGA